MGQPKRLTNHHPHIGPPQAWNVQADLLGAGQRHWQNRHLSPQCQIGCSRLSLQKSSGLPRASALRSDSQDSARIKQTKSLSQRADVRLTPLHPDDAGSLQDRGENRIAAMLGRRKRCDDVRHHKKQNRGIPDRKVIGDQDIGRLLGNVLGANNVEAHEPPKQDLEKGM